jgi:hypothetical protein
MSVLKVLSTRSLKDKATVKLQKKENRSTLPMFIKLAGLENWFQFSCLYLFRDIHILKKMSFP